MVIPNLLDKRVKTLLRWAVLSVASLVTDAAWSCALPVPFGYFYQNNVSASLAGGPCALTVGTIGASRTTAAAFFHYRRASPLTSVRYGFRVDDSALSGGSNLEDVQLFAATSPVVTLSPATSTVLAIALRTGSPQTVIFYAADGNSAGGTKSVPVTLISSKTTVRVEINVAAAGNIKYWINHPFTDPPDGVIETSAGSGLDNAGLQGVIAAEIGLSRPSVAFRTHHADEALVFDQVESNDDVLFYDDFSRGAQ